MRKRKLGRHGLEVSEIGFGAWQLGDENLHGRLSEDEGLRMVHAALDHGCQFFDTAPNYGLGRSEEILGRALKGRRASAVISTKFGHHSDGRQDYSATLIRGSVESSLKRLQTDYTDIVLLHNPPAECLDSGSPSFNELMKLQKEGKVRSFGASVDYSPDLNRLLSGSQPDAAEIMFNILHQEPMQAMEKAAAAGIGLIVKIPLDSGWLSGKYNENSRFGDIRGRWSPQEIERRAAALKDLRWLTEGGLTMTQAALAFVLAHPSVSSVIPGVKNTASLLENLKAAEVKLPAGAVEKLHAWWQEKFAANPLGW